MVDMSWNDAIKKVLAEQGEPMRASEIVQAIVDGGLRTKVGATPNTAVGAFLSQEPLRSEVEKIERGVYRYPAVLQPPSGQPRPLDIDINDQSNVVDIPKEERGLLNAFGLFWRRAEIDWAPTFPRMLGVQLAGSSAVDFSAQEGVYLLYDGSRLVYVGRVSEPRFGKRLREHTRDRLSGRWDRFSWFGVRPVGDGGELEDVPIAGLNADMVISTLEALLIEALEPPQNRRQGDGFAELEFIQSTDPNIEKLRKKRLLDEMSSKL